MNASLPLSVIIPVYNGEETLERCLASVFHSEFSPFQTIVVDDGSTDRSAEIAATFPCEVVRIESHAGTAMARNRGAREARGKILFFLDSDILIEPDSLTRILRTLAARPEISALFGSYQKNTVPTNFVSVYKNLLHHYTHQNSSAEAVTFCGGFGAVRRAVFAELGGFAGKMDALEDVEIGYRMHRAGHRILLDKTLQFTHCKKYSLVDLIYSDVLNRAIPWTKLMLRWRIFRNDLNTKSNNVASVILAYLILATLALSVFKPAAIILLLIELALLVILNAGLFSFVYRERGLFFTLGTIGMSWLNYIYSGIGFAAGLLAFVVESLLSFRAERSRVEKSVGKSEISPRINRSSK